MAYSFTTPVGRLVYGDVFEARAQTKNGQAVLIKSGPNAGKPKISCNFGLAVPKVLANGMPNTAMDEFRRNIIEQARAGYPQFFNGAIDVFTGKPGSTHPRMTFKIQDGDGVDGEGKPNSGKEGWAGNWVITFSSTNPPRVFDIEVGLDPAQQLQDKTRVLPGDYIAVQGTCEANIGSETPGVYMNHSMVCRISGGVRIVNGPKAADAFAGIAAGALPPGCVIGANPANVAPTPPAAPVPPTPPVPPAPPTPPAAPAGPQLTPAAMAAGFTTYAAARAAGWGDDALIAAGYLIAAAPTPSAAPVPPTPPVPPAPPTPPAAPAGPQLTPAAMAAGFTSYAQAIANHWTDDMLRQHGYLA
jgi:hypothetical protein